jgi:hypothetical protein
MNPKFNLMTWFMKKPCKNCPYRKDVRPFLTPERGEDLAVHSCNKYNSFTCHQTLDNDDDGDTVVVAESLECAGYMTMQCLNEGDDNLHGEEFTPSYDLVYEDMYDMIAAYEDPDIWEKFYKPTERE